MKKIVSIIIVFLLGFQLVPIVGQAAENMQYSVKANIPDNQIDKKLTYFDLRITPSQKQTITLIVSNSSDKEETIIISPNVAVTNQNGVIDYSKFESKLDSSFKVPLSSVISEKQEVTLAAKESKEVSFTLQMPKESFDGIILGGFYITKKESADKKEEEKNVQIKNNYSYVIGIKLRETDVEVKPEIVLNDIQPDLLNYRTVVTANLQNTKATMIKDLNVTAKVFKKGETTVLHETSKEGMSMAPNSNFDFPINWDNQPLDAGDYTLQLVAKSGDNEWKFEKDFVIDEKEVKPLNDEAVELEKAETNLLLPIILAIVATVALMAVIFYLLSRHKKKKEAEKKALLRKKKKKKKKKSKSKNN
ncbi:DUF916 and DUF3324 domain-containing protein [Carnobacterium maltaromaticum]|uniref:DUF916 and DUF3324 domain-containing protein n=1 Tax=Carnobacterium maltaromaticum TaxID=2751 RepID=UPI00295EA5AC|nr:DUF916 and DUF3324 domain-containing protein [Carnobacterium maltaromaticum]